MAGNQLAPFDVNRKTQGQLAPKHGAAPATSATYGYGYGDAGPYAADASGAPGDLGFYLREYLRILNKRKWIIISVLTAILLLGTVRTLMMTPLYTATVGLQINRAASQVMEGGNIAPQGAGEAREFLNTQHELLESRAIAKRVVSALQLADDAAFLKPREFSILANFKSIFASEAPLENPEGPNRTDRERAATNIILSRRGVAPRSGTLLVDVSYSDPDPNYAQRIASALADAYIAANLDKRFEAGGYAKTFLEDQSAQLKLRLEESEKVHLEFAEKEQIVATTEKTSIAENNLASANAALGSLISERIKNEQIWRQVASSDAINTPQLLSNEIIGELRNQRNALMREYEEKLETFKPRYPTMVQIKNKLKEIDRQLELEVQTIKDSLKANYESSKSQETEMKMQIEKLRSEFLDLQKRSIQYNMLKREVDINRRLYEGLLQRQKEVNIAAGVGSNNVFIVDKAERPTTPSSPKLSRALLLSLVLGLGAGVAVAYVLEQFDDTLLTIEDIERITGLTTLGIIPKNRGKDSAESTLEDPRSNLSEAYRSLCTALQFSTENGLPKTLFITSAGPGEGKSLTSVAIARYFASLGLKVLLIDGDLRNPSLHMKLNSDNEIGLSNYLTGSYKPPEVIQATSIPSLAFMASGPLPPSAAELLGNPRMMSLFSIGSEIFDLIVMDGPPVMGLADALLLSNAAGATLFVIGAGQTRAGLVCGALKRLQIGQGSIVGTVFTKFDAKAAGYGYGYGYGDNHSYGYGENYLTGGSVTQSEPDRPQIASAS